MKQRMFNQELREEEGTSCINEKPRMHEEEHKCIRKVHRHCIQIFVLNLHSNLLINKFGKLTFFKNSSFFLNFIDIAIIPHSYETKYVRVMGSEWSKVMLS